MICAISVAGGWFDDVAVYIGSEGGRFGAESVRGRLGRDRKPRRGHGPVRSARVDVFGSAVTGVGRLPVFFLNLLEAYLI